MPQDRARWGIGIKGIDAVVLRGDEHHVVRAAADAQVGDIQWLRIEIPINCAGKPQPECRRAHRCGREGVFLQVLGGACNVVMLSKHAGQIRHRCRDRSADGGVRHAGGGHRVRTRLGTRREQAGRGDGPRRGIATRDPVHRPRHAAILWIVCDCRRELQRLRRRHLRKLGADRDTKNALDDRNCRRGCLGGIRHGRRGECHGSRIRHAGRPRIGCG